MKAINARCRDGILVSYIDEVPFPYRPGVHGVMAVGTEPQTMPEARLTHANPEKRKRFHINSEKSRCSSAQVGALLALTATLNH